MLIKEMMGRELADLKIDRKLAKELYGFQTRFVVKNKDNASFFGGALIGVVDLYFKDQDVNEFFDVILKKDRSEIRASYSDAPSIIPSRKITGDVMNITIFYLIHRFLSATDLPEKTRYRAAFDLLLIFNYRTIAALHSKGFKYLGTVELATSTYEALSEKFILKQLGSWKAYMVYRAEHTLSGKKRLSALTSMNSDKLFLNVIADTQGDIRSTFKLIYRLREKIREAGTSLSSHDLINSMGEQDEIADVTVGVSVRVEKVLRAMQSIGSFVDPRITTLIIQLVPNTTEEQVNETISGIIKYSHGRGHKRVSTYVRDLLSYLHRTVMLSKLADDPDSLKDLGIHIPFVKGLLTTSRSTDAKLLSLRDDGSYIIRHSTKLKDRQLLIKHRLSFSLYLYIKYLVI